VVRNVERLELQRTRLTEELARTKSLKEKDVIRIIRENSKVGMIFVHPVSNAIEISSGKEGDEVL